MTLNSLGIAKKPEETRVVVAMSGGVDSSVTAALLKEQGYDVIGITLQLYDHGMVLEKSNTCCAGQDIYDARRVAEHLNFPHYVLDYETRFKDSVIQDFADSYLRGETPIPCVRCNQSVKFVDLLKTAEELKADVLATGHYVQRLEGQHGPELHRAASDDGKDQSYFLFATTKEQLKLLRFPLGGQPKSETRKLALKYGLSIADKPDSQDICFVPDGDYASLIRKLRPQANTPGSIVDLNGTVLGSHDGIINFTIGQRKGLKISGLADPLYVVRLDPKTQDVIVGPKEALGRTLIYLKETNWLAQERPLHEGLKIRAKLRSAGKFKDGTVYLKEEGRAEVHLDEPEFGVAPGQALVCYQGSQVLGGGWIVGAEQSFSSP